MASPSATTMAALSQELERAAMRAEFQKFADAKVEQRFSGLSPEARALMAIAPAWTAEFLEHAGLLPTQSEGLLGELVRRGAIERVDEVTAHKLGQPPLYSMKVQARADVLDRSGQPAEFGRVLTSVSIALGKGAQLGNSPADPERLEDDRLAPFHRFVELMRRYSNGSRGMIQHFDSVVDGALGTTGAAPSLEDRVGEVRRWIAAARPIADVLPRVNDPSLELAIERAVCKVELARRDERDREHLGPRLERFVRRTPLEMAFRELMGPDHNAWALHFIGGGGVGKTMFIRHICFELAKEFDCAVARIDFDYLNPDYPRFAPGHLLWAFAQELAAFDTSGRASSRFSEAAGMFDRLHEELSRTPPAASERGSDHPMFRAGLRCYIDALHDLRRPVLLIVDTCEELGKLRPDGRAPESVRETFAILESLQREAPTLRVLFSGRRPLARGGFGGWTTAQHELDERPYLRVHEILGFTRDEARELLGARMSLESALVDAIWQRTAEDPMESDILWATPRAPNEMPRRCNPYELRLFAEWAREEPSPSPAEIMACNDDRYVEVRVISRITNDRIRSLLPLLAIMGQAERATLRHALGPEVGDDEFETLFRELCRQEWNSERTSPIPGGEGSWHFVQVRGPIRRRLLSWSAKHPDDRAIQRATDELQRQTLDADLSTLDWTTYDALFRLLSSDPARAGEWWARASERILRERGDLWLLEVTRRLLGSDGAFGAEGGAKDPSPSIARAEVIAAHVAALLHGDGTVTEIHDCWIELGVFAAEHASLFPKPAHAAVHRFRAAAGLTGLAERFGEPIAGRAGEFVRALDALLTIQSGSLTADQIASAIAAIEAMVEHAEAKDEPQRTQTSGDLIRSLCSFSEQRAAKLRAGVRPDPVGEFLGRFEASFANVLERAGPLDPARVLRATFDSLHARARYLERDYSRSLYPEGSRLPEGIDRGRWSDWIAPDDPDARLALIDALATYPRVRRTGDWRLERLASEGGIRSIDEDRCRSYQLRCGTADGPMLAEERHALTTLVDQGPLGLAALSRFMTGERCNAHYAALPYGLEAARALALDGRPDHARSLLLRMLAAPAFGATIRARQTLEEVTRRYRLRDTSRASAQTKPGARESNAIELLCALDGLDGQRRRVPLRGVVATEGRRSAWREFHSIWRGLYAAEDRAVDAEESSRRLVEVLDWYEANFVQLALAHGSSIKGGGIDIAGTDFDAMMVKLDLEEATLLGPRLSRNREAFPLTSFEPLTVDPMDWWARNQDLPEQALRLCLRLGALRPGSCVEESAKREPRGESQFEIPRDLVHRLGRRRWAEIALDEGELLSLRLPDRAAWILRCAAAWFEDADDHAGCLISRTLAILSEHCPGATPAQQRAELLRCVQKTPIADLLIGGNAGSSVSATREVEAEWSVPPSLFTLHSLEALRRHEKSAWYPWLARVLMAVCPPTVDELHALREWLEDSFGLQARDGGVLLPAEMAMWAARVRPLPERAGEPSPASPSSAPSGKSDENAFELSALSNSTPPAEPSPAATTGPPPSVPAFMWRLVASLVNRFASKIFMVGLGIFIAVAIPFAIVRALWQAAVQVAQGRDPTLGAYPTYAVLGLLFLALLFWTELRTSRRAWPWIALVLLVAAFQLLSPTPSVRPFNWMAWIAWAGGTAVGLGAIHRIFALRAASRIAGGGVRVRISTERDGSAPVSDLENARVRAVVSWVGSAWRPTADSASSLDMPENLELNVERTGPYANFTDALDPRVSASLGAHADRIRPFAADTIIVCDEGGDGPCWEATFGPRRGPGKPGSAEAWLARCPYRFRRETAYTKMHYADTLELIGHRAICWSDEHDSSAQSLFSVWSLEWKRAAETSAFLVLDDTSERAKTLVMNLEANTHGQEVRLLHLLGDTELTSSGVAWRIGGRVPDRFASHASANDVGASRVAGLVRPDEVLRHFDTLRVCVLQGVDRAGPEQRRESDRIKAFQAREFAGALANGGIPLVLVLPPLESSVAAECVRMFVKAILEDPRGGMAFAEIAHRIRLHVLSRVVATWPHAAETDVARDAALELALDVCVFCAGDFNARRVKTPGRPETARARSASDADRV